MRYINKLNSDPFQTAYLTGNAGQRIRMDLRYNPTQKVWMADFSLGTFTINGISVVKSPNLLRNYRNIIPFGLVVTTADGQDPRNVEDFSTQYAAMYLLTKDEVEEMERLAFS